MDEQAEIAEAEEAEVEGFTGVITTRSNIKNGGAMGLGGLGGPSAINSMATAAPVQGIAIKENGVK